MATPQKDAEKCATRMVTGNKHSNELCIKRNTAWQLAQYLHVETGLSENRVPLKSIA